MSTIEQDSEYFKKPRIENNLEFHFDIRHFGFALTYDRDTDYKWRNELQVKVLFWTLNIRFNFSFWTNL